MEYFFKKKPKDECGIFGISNDTNAANLTALGLHALQHRGQDSTGIVTSDKINFFAHRGMGQVSEVFSNSKLLETLKGSISIGHNRYGTTGESALKNVQPLFSELNIGGIAIAHNGNLTNTNQLKEKLIRSGSIFQSTSDTEVILHLLSTSSGDLLERLTYALNSINGAYSLLLMTIDKLIGVRDPFGIRPLVLGKYKNSYVLSSESCGLDIIGAELIRDVEPGEIIIIKEDKIQSIKPFNRTQLRPCLFEYIYFARPDSILDKLAIHKSRIAIGRLLGEKMKDTWNCNDIDIIVPVPDTSITFANGIQDVINKPLREGLIRNRYIDRTFIMENFKMIRTNIRRKLSGIESVFKNRNVLIVDDSIVRGNTSRHIIEIARNFGAKKIYFGSCAPIISNTNKYGINIPTKNELISYNRDESDIAEYLGVDYLIYNDLDKITQKLMEINSNFDGFETSMFL